jgi:hypothetical protein
VSYGGPKSNGSGTEIPELFQYGRGRRTRTLRSHKTADLQSTSPPRHRCLARTGSPCTEATKFRSNRFGTIGRSSRLSVARIRYGRTMMARMPLVHQPLDLTAACPVALSLQFDMNRQASLASVVVAMDPARHRQGDHDWRPTRQDRPPALLVLRERLSLTSFHPNTS